MVNRIRERATPEDDVPEEDFWSVSGDGGWFYVTEETARRILGLLERDRPPRWLRFTDLFGGEVRILSRGVDCVRECTQAHRAAERSFHRARHDERKADGRPWEDDEPW